MTEQTADKIETFFAKYRLRHYAKGQVLILNGDRTNYIYHLIKGKVKQYDVTYRGEEVILNVFKPPAFFPMSLAINKVQNPYIYEAETEIEVRQVPAQEAVAFIKANPDVMFDLLCRVYRGIDGILGRMAHLMSSSARGRLIYEIILEARRFGAMQPDGGCLLSITEKDLGARAGLTRETVSREISKLKAEGLIDVGSKDILVKNMTLLEQKPGQVV
jgi:CRP-like cAMP-binding protein